MSNCPQCQAPLTSHLPLGVCPACLLEGATRSRADAEAAEYDCGFLEAGTREESLGVFDGYEVLEVLGHGGSGIVLKAQDRSLQRMVAIKVLHPVVATSAVSRARFLREARAAAAVSHPHVVTIHAVGEWKGLPYLVMECIEGGTLGERIAAEGTLEVREILRIGRQMAAGLAAAHAQGLVHRDVKPGNVLLENSVERVRLSDFGLARTREETSLTLTGYVSGTPEYMSPEQAEGRETDGRSDLYSLGAVVYAMATGLAPFRGSSVIALLHQVAEAAPAPPRTLGSEIPSWLEKMILKLLAKSPAARPQSAEELEEWFASKLAGLQSGAVSATAAENHGRGTMAATATLAAVVAVAALGWAFRNDGGAAAKAHRAEDMPASPRSPAGPPADPDAAATPVANAERERFERYIEFVQDGNPRERIGPAPALADLIAPGSEVYHAGWYRQGIPDLRNSAKNRDEGLNLPGLARRMDSERAEDAVFVLFLTGESPRPDGAVFRPLRGMRNVIERKPVPPRGVWIGALCSPEAHAMLPEEHRENGLDIWAVFPAKSSEP